MTAAAELVAEARRAAALTQRELARRTGVAQPTIARIERGHVDPRMSTVACLIAACGVTLSASRTPGWGIDRTQMRELLELSPRARVELLRQDAAGLERLDRALDR